MFYLLDKSLSWARLSTISLKLRRAIRHLFFGDLNQSEKKSEIEPPLGMAGHKVLMSSATVCIFRHLKFHPAIQFVQFDWYETGNDHPFIYCVYIILKSREKYDLLLLFMTVWRNFQEKIKLRDGNMYIFFPAILAFFGQICFSYRHLEIKFPTFILFGMKWNEMNQETAFFHCLLIKNLVKLSIISSVHDNFTRFVIRRLRVLT